VVRAAIQVVMGYALPTLYKDWGYAESLWALPQFIFVISGGVSMLLCGMYENRINPVKLIFHSMALSVPFYFLFLYAGLKGSAFSFLLVGMVGFINAASFPVNVVMGQKRMPEFAGTVSGILTGAGWSLASLASLFISAVAASGLFPERYGKLLPGMAIIGLLPLLGAWISRRLAKDQK
jgi:MFS family permease